MPKSERFQIGEFWLSRHHRTGIWQICWYDSKTRHARSRSIGTREEDIARERLASHVITHQTLDKAHPATVPVVAVLRRRRERRKGIRAQEPMRAAQIVIDRHFQPDETVDDLTADRLREFYGWMLSEAERRDGGRGYSLGYVRRVRSELKAGLRQMKLARELSEVPEIPDPMDLCRDLVRQAPGRGRPRKAATFNPRDLAKFLHHSLDVVDDDRLWRWAVLSMATGGRAEAILELRPDQVFLREGKIRLLQEGEEQTKKRRATLPIPLALFPWLRIWLAAPGEAPLVNYRGKPIANNRKAFEQCRDAAGLGAGFQRRSFRRTVGDWLRQQRCAHWDVETYLGHRLPSTSEDYVLHDGEYLDECSQAIDLLFVEVQHELLEYARRRSQPVRPALLQSPELERLHRTCTAPAFAFRIEPEVAGILKVNATQGVTS